MRLLKTESLQSASQKMQIKLHKIKTVSFLVPSLSVYNDGKVLC